MAYRGTYSFGSYHSTPWVKRLMIANLVVFIVTSFIAPGLTGLLQFEPSGVLFRPWTLLTYMFVHAGFWHIFFNMLSLFFFGPWLEERWGSREFIKYYLICGMGGAVLSFVFAFNSAVVGASAAVYGVMLAFAMNWPDMPIYIYAIFPVKAKWLIIVMVAFSLYSAVLSRGGDVAHFAHLGGFAAGYVYLKLDSKSGGPFRQMRRMLTRPKLTVVSGAASPPKPPEKTRRRVEERVYDDVDKVLDKITTKGMASLTPEELKLLDEVSKRYRQN